MEGVHKRMDRVSDEQPVVEGVTSSRFVQVEDEMTDTQSQMTAFKRKVKDDVGQLEKRLRALASKVAAVKVRCRV